jgi:hypothetical protein
MTPERMPDEPGVPRLHHREQRSQDARPRAAQRVAERDGADEDVDVVGVELELAHHAHRLPRSRPVELPHLAAPDASVRTIAPNPSLRAGDDRCPLEPGVYGLGGRAADAIPLAALASQPRAATLTVSEDYVVTVQRRNASPEIFTGSFVPGAPDDTVTVFTY